MNELGKPMFIHATIANLSRPSVVRVCVEVDLLHSLPSRVWFGTENSNERFWQSLQADNFSITLTAGIWGILVMFIIRMHLLEIHPSS